MQPAEFEDFARALCDAGASLPQGLRNSTGMALEDRFAVYRNNVHASLVTALCENFPVSLALVGDEFFRAMARTYVQQHKPDSAQLHAYGRELPQYIAAFTPARELPYLADVAAVEAAWSQSWAAADQPSITLAALAAVPAEVLADSRVVPHAAMRLIRSDWPAGSIWQAHQSAHPDLSTILWQAECVLITRPAASIHLQLLPTGPAVFADLLLRGGLDIESAAGAALTISPTLDIGRVLRELIESGAITEILAP